MAYNNAIPQSTDSGRDSQPAILANFQAIKQLIDVNHDTFGAANEGKHNQVSLPSQGAAPAFLATETGFYNKVYATTTKNESYIHNQTLAATSEIPFSASVLSTTAPAAGMNWWTYLPSGLLMMGVSYSTVGGVETHNIPVGPTWPVFNEIFNIMVMPYDAAAGDVNFAIRLIGGLGATQFQTCGSLSTTLGPTAGFFTALIVGR